MTQKCRERMKFLINILSRIFNPGSRFLFVSWNSESWQNFEGDYLGFLGSPFDVHRIWQSNKYRCIYCNVKKWGIQSAGAAFPTNFPLFDYEFDKSWQNCKHAKALEVCKQTLEWIGQTILRPHILMNIVKEYSYLLTLMIFFRFWLVLYYIYFFRKLESHIPIKRSNLALYDMCF